MKNNSPSRFGRRAKQFGTQQQGPLQNISPTTSPELASAFSRALALHQAGRLAEAEKNYLQILKAQPKHFDSLHLLGVIYHQRGKHAEAVRQIDVALKIDPKVAFAHNNRGIALKELRRFDEALASYDRAIALKPDYAEAFYNRGIALQELKQDDEALASYDEALVFKASYAEAFNNRGNALQALKRLEEAVASYDKALTLEPDYAEAFSNRGNALQKLKRFDQALASYDKALSLTSDYADAFYNRGLALQELKRFEEALASYDKTLTLKPDYAEAFSNRGLVLQELKRFDEALVSCDKALALKPDYAEAFSNRSLALKELKRLDEAMASCDEAIALKPDYAEAFSNRGNILQELKRLDEALASYDKALTLKPDYAEALSNRGLALKELKRFDEALASYDRALALKPDYPEAFNDRGVALQELKRFDEALASYDKAIAVKPDYAEAFYNRGVALQELKRFDEALASYDKALAVKPDHAHAFSGIAVCVNMICDWRRMTALADDVTAHVSEKKSTISPFTLLSYIDAPALQLQCARKYVADEISPLPQPLRAGAKWRHDKVRIAYLSADFRDHAVSYLMAGLFEQHDRARFEVLAVSFGPDSPSEMRSRLEGAFDRFIDVRRMSDRAVANLLRDLEVDIAVDLMGFTYGNRLGIFALRPAPVQVNYLGFPGTIGADFMDYIIADRFVVPLEHQAYYTEKVVYLPDTFQANDATRRIGRVPGRSEMGLPESGFVFCSFNNSNKITPTMFDIWMRLLGAMEGSVLWLLGGNTSIERNLRREAEDRGIAANRLIFAPRVGYSDYLARYQLADLFLDTLPFNAGTTASDALWAGLPLVTCAGEVFAARMAGSLLNSAGLPDLVTHSLDEYEALALRLARDGEALTGIKTKLAQNRLTCPLFDTDRFRRHIEAAYLQMWKIWQRGEQPRSFAVEM